MEFDYVVVGGGTSGPAVARRLAEGDPASKVLLVEAGISNEGLIPAIMPMAWQNLKGTEHLWGYKSEPLKAIDGRVIDLPRGKFLGGSSGMNGTMVVRGPKADYDEWAKFGNDGWGWNDVLPFFKKSETFLSSDGFQAATGFHGINGPVHTSVHPLAPISEAVLESLKDKGFEYKPDMFVQGEVNGVGRTSRTINGGVRTSGADYVNKDKPSNLEVLFSTTVLRVILEDAPAGGNPTLRAVALEAETKTEGAPTLITIKAKKEIVLSAGVYNSPTILLHSGVGPKGHLEEVGIKTKVDAPGVGQNLSDHIMTVLHYALKSNMTYDNLIYPPGAIDATIGEWVANKTGLMSRLPFGPLAYKRLDDRLKDKPEWKAAPGADPTGQSPDQPHVAIASTEMYVGPPELGFNPTLPTDSIFGMVTILTCPQSRGTVRLASSNPHDAPKIDHNYFASELDATVLAEGTRLAHEIAVEGAGTREHIAGPWPKQAVLPPDDEAWKAFVKNFSASVSHAAGTCKMGPKSDAQAVVDPRLRVKGIQGLRVADVSIMPKLINGFPMAAAFMIGEKAAQLILEDNRSA